MFLFQINAVLLKKKKKVSPFHKKLSSKKKFSTLLIIQHQYQLMIIEHIRMISEGSCDTKYWSNEAEKN